MHPRLIGVFPLTVVKSANTAAPDIMSQLGTYAGKAVKGLGGIGDYLGEEARNFIPRIRAGDPTAITQLTTLLGGGIGGIGGMLMGGEGNRIMGGLAGAGIGAGLGAGAGYADREGMFGYPGAIGLGLDKGINQARPAINRFGSNFNTAKSARAAVFQHLGLSKRALDGADLDALLPDKGGVASDFALFPGAQRRAGRASALAESLDNDAPSDVNYPRTIRILRGLLGAAGGAGVGAGAAALMNRADPNASSQTSAQRTATGAGVGAGVGSLLAMLVDAKMRRKGIAGVKAQAKSDLAAGERPTGSINHGNAFAAPVSGIHQQGRADTAEAITQGKRRFRGNGVMTALHAVGMIPGVGPIAGVAGMLGNVGNYAEASGRIARATPQAVRAMAA